MLGHTLMAELDRIDEFEVYGSARSVKALGHTFPPHLLSRVTSNIDVRDNASLCQLLDGLKPDVVVNCIGVIKQSPDVQNRALVIEVNSLFPHRLAQACTARGIRTVHISTDCVFSGRRGNYVETDQPDPVDLYGRSKLVGEVVDPPALTLRTSIVGRELGPPRSLFGWFLSQTTNVQGYTRAIYSGITTRELAQLLASVVLPRPSLVGLYHVASQPINKYDLLRLVADIYQWPGEIVPCEDFVCDRTLCADAFFAATGYCPPGWEQMIRELRGDSSPLVGSASVGGMTI